MANSSKFTFKIGDTIYRLLTGKPLTSTSAKISNTFIFLSSRLIIAKILVMISSIFVGKFLGANYFGSLALIMAIGNFLCLPFFTSWGLSYVNQVSSNIYGYDPEEFLSSSLIMSFGSILLIFPLLYVFKTQFANILNVDQDILYWGYLFGIIMGGYYFCKSIFQANQNWSSFAKCELLFAFCMVIGICILFSIQPVIKIKAVIFVFILAHFVGSIPALRIVLRKLRFPRSKSLLITAQYGIGLIGSFGLSLIAMQLDKFYLNHYADSIAVGRYQAYYISTFGLLNGFTTILNNYLLPLYGKFRQENFKKILLRFLLVISVPLSLGCIVFGRIAFLIFGKAFSFNWIELISASAFNLVIFCLQVTVFFSMSLGIKALVHNTAVYIVFIVIQVLSMPFLIQKYGVSGAFLGMTLASAASLFTLVGLLFIFSNKKDTI